MTLPPETNAFDVSRFRTWPLLLLSLLAAGCASWNAVTRQIAPGEPSRSAYIESRGPVKFACSFVEFDGKGDLLSLEQLTGLQKRLRAEMGPENPKIILVFYCHGWRNNAQSGDVVYFLRLLKRTAERMGDGYRVEGVYFAWRGNPFKASISSDDQAVADEVAGDFGGPVLDISQTQPLPHAVTWVPETLSEFVIQHRAEYNVSHIGLADALFSVAETVKAGDGGGRNHAIVIGHSFGALLLERAIGPASVSLLTAESANPGSPQYWPFDLVIYLNAAAPSLYAKQVIAFLDRHYEQATRPMFLSITSSADSATGFWFPVANAKDRYFAADLKRDYPAYQDDAGTISAGEYYQITAGHSPLFISRTITRLAAEDRVAPADLTEASEMNVMSLGRSQRFKTRDGKQWLFSGLDDDAIRAANGGRLPVHIHSPNYWVIGVDQDLIASHGDVWNEDFTEVLTGICTTIATGPKPDRLMAR